MQQLPLGITLRVDIGFDNFVAGQNDLLIRTLKHIAMAPQQAGMLYLHGLPASGRSHLLQASAALAQQSGFRVAYVPLRWPAISPDHLEGLESCDLLVLDDLDAVSNNVAWAVPLFHLFNRLRDHQRSLIVSAERPPASLPCALPDLSSRLCSMPIYSVQALDDADRLQLLKLKSANQGMSLPDDVALYLLHHAPRDIAQMIVYLQRLDDASLAQQRRLTIPFVKQVLGC